MRVVVSYFQCQTARFTKSANWLSENLQRVRLFTDHFTDSDLRKQWKWLHYDYVRDVAYSHNCVSAVNSGKIQQVFANIV